jgi:hypothetical protein
MGEEGNGEGSPRVQMWRREKIPIAASLVEVCGPRRLGGENLVFVCREN